jgi:hypothetical protein
VRIFNKLMNNEYHLTRFATACWLTILSATAFAQTPRIIYPPNDQSVSIGAIVTNTVTAIGTSPLHYQWFLNQSEIFNATNRVLVVSNVQVADAGGYFVVVTNLSGSVTSRVAHLDVDPTFTKITTGDIVTEPNNGFACAWGDYDNDGYIDLIITCGINNPSPTPHKNLLFHNERDGTFKKITNSVICGEARDWRGCNWVDFDNDGFLDLIVTSEGLNGFAAQSELFRNNGDGTFTKLTPRDGGDLVSMPPGGSEGCVCADYDNDGFVDVFIAGYGPDRLFHNDGAGHFSSITSAAVGPASDDSYAAAWCDYNNDGWPDLFVSVKSQPPTNRLYLNLDGAFSLVSGATFTNHAHSFGCAWGDYDNDGYLDLFVANGGYISPNEPNFLFHNNGDGSLTRITNVTAGSIVSDAGWTGGCAWGDYDNDGFLDLFVVSAPNFFYHNNGDRSFTRILTGSVVNDLEPNTIGCAWGDYDNDGFLDLVVVGGATSAPETTLLYRNNGNTNAWIKFRLVGTLSNRSAIGAKVRVLATIRGRSFWQMREINTGSGLGADSLDAHFGLGDATNIDLVRIEWPSGIVQTLTNVAPRQHLTVTEHQEIPPPKLTFTGAGISPDGQLSLAVSGSPGALLMFEASSNLHDWTKIGVRSNATGSVQFLDPKSVNFNRRFYRVSAP